MEERTVLIERDGPVAVIRLNRPERMNAVVEAMYRELGEALDEAAAAAEVRAVVLTGSDRVRDGISKPAFCAGADLKEHRAGGRSREQQRAYLELAHATTRRLAELPKPVVAAVNGPARGAGAEMAVCCDLILMAEEATLAFTETGLGTFVGGGVTLLLPRLVGLVRAKELIYTGRVVDGRAAVELGLALRAVPHARLLADARRLAGELAERAPLSMRLAKRLLHEAATLSLAEALERETEAILACMGTDDWHEGVRAFAERRPPRFEGR